MIRVLDGEADSILLEPVGIEGHGVEFCVNINGSKEFHQVKRQNSEPGHWTLSALNKRKVLSHCHAKLSDESAHFYFVSTQSANSLQELIDRVKSSNSYEDFAERFLLGKAHTRVFDELCGYWPSSGQRDVFQMLGRIHIRTIDEDFLREWLNVKLEGLVDGLAPTVVSVLTDFASQHLHQELYSALIWDYLERQGFHRQTWVSSRSISEIVAEHTRVYLAGIQPTGIAGYMEPRDERDQILAYFSDEHKGNVAFITGKAGVGKSSLVSLLIEKAESLNIPSLVLRVDQLDSCNTPTEIGTQLELPASPDSVLLGIAKGKKCFLVIDQLDAISLVSGRNPNFFGCIGHLIRRSTPFPNLKVLVACRKFDVENDPRLSSFLGEAGIGHEFPLDDFDIETTCRLLELIGIDAASLSQDQMKLFSTPVHLRMLSDLNLEKHAQVGRVKSAKLLYEHFWDQKRRFWEADNRDVRCMTEAIEALAVHMSGHQSLSAPVTILDIYVGAADLLISENILAKRGSKISFFHESFFDFMYARSEVSTDFDLLDFVQERAQSLFLRSQLRQILLHLQDFDYLKAIQSVRSLLASDKVRPHLKGLILALVGGLSNPPTREEWQVIEKYLDTELSSFAWKAVFGSELWFDLLDELGVIRKWLENGAAQNISRAMELMRSVEMSRAGRVAAILTPMLNSSKEMDKRIKNLVVLADLTISMEFLAFSVNAVKKGVLDDFLKSGERGPDLWHWVEPLVTSQPIWACKLVSAICYRRLSLVRNSSSREELFPYEVDPHSIGGEVVLSTAQAVPQQFLKNMWPFLIEVLAVFADKEGSLPRRDSVWKYPAKESSYGTDLATKILEAIELSWRKSVETNPDVFVKYSLPALKSPYLTMQYLVMRGYEACGRRLAAEAADYILEFPETRLTTREPSWLRRAAGPVIKAISPYCTDEQLLRMEEIALGYYPYGEPPALQDSEENPLSLPQFELLSYFEVSRLSVRAKSRLQELGQKYKFNPENEIPRRMAGWVGPAIPESVLVKMTDVEWLEVIRQFPQEDPQIAQDGTLQGGALEISQILESTAKRDPSRFSNLIHDVPDDAHPYYFNAILRGTTGSDLSAETVTAACLRCHRIPLRPVGLCIAQALGAISSTLLPRKALELVAWYATKDPDPDPDPDPVILSYILRMKLLTCRPAIRSGNC